MFYDLESKLETYIKFFDEDFLPFLLIGHYDADGLISLSIIAKILYQRRIPFILRISETLNVNEIKESAFSKIVILDFQLNEEIIKVAEEKRILLIDHHPLKSETEKLLLLHPSILGINDEYSACSSTLAYLVARNIDDSFVDLSPLAIAGALEDKMDIEEKRSFRGINKLVLDEAEEAGLINKEEGLICYTDFSDTIPKIISLSFEPFFPNLFSSQEKAMEYLKRCDIDNKYFNKSYNEISKNEIAEITKKIAKQLLKEGYSASLVEKLYGYNFITSLHIKHRNLRFIAKSIDYLARSSNFSDFLNSLFNERLYRFPFEKYFNEYISLIERTLLKWIYEKKTKEYKKLFYLKFEGKIDRFVGSFANLLISSNINKPVIVIASEFSDEEYKLSLRANEAFTGDLASLVSIIAKKHGGNGGGHRKACGAIIPKAYIEDFLEELNDSL